MAEFSQRILSRKGMLAPAKCLNATVALCITGLAGVETLKGDIWPGVNGLQSMMPSSLIMSLSSFVYQLTTAFTSARLRPVMFCTSPSATTNPDSVRHPQYKSFKDRTDATVVPLPVELQARLPATNSANRMCY